ncbi:hypothetical protein LCGC14_0359150 [marine sediment metagenome]|uniref:Uncharacterized protein n=1 Tax=marine sediment metagenome TaxID=412755 RepID=A0A0F9T8F8_9ZZZZ|nr:hypothetical protein [Candidatus Aminicenantes bacterium]
MSDPKYKHIGSLAIRLIEECSELTKEVCKAERFGYLNYHPEDEKKTPNIERIRKEMADVLEAYHKLTIPHIKEPK